MLEGKLANAGLIKKIIESIKELVDEATFDCSRTAISLQAMDSSHVAMVSLKLKASLFETYRCDRNINLGLSLANMSKALKCANNDDKCIFKYTEKDGDAIVFTFANQKQDKTQDVTVKMMDIDSEHLDVPDQEYSVVCEMPAA
ncbi:unnamed protein product [Caenorhabditis angaria]|uniref:Proliferating cell nuclear antigen PCNA N-terminal domain-containing protein n=1 Tax=Caenorhabditis angaria TaxID=860376 RepID=A0A9P1I4H8_9PELO|nr:unnamed protein product [Caenorhabditis angaria]